MKFLLCLLAILALSLSAECAVLNLNVKNIDGAPAAGATLQIFPESISINSDIPPIAEHTIASDGKLRVDLAEGIYTLVAFSQDHRFLVVREVSVPNSLTISAADAVPVTVNCRAADGSPIVNARIFFRPAMRSRASVGVTDNKGLLKAYVSPGNYHAVLHSFFGTGPHYLVLPNQKILTSGSQVDFDVAKIPTSDLHFNLPEGTAIAIFEVLESQYTYEYSEGVEPEIGYDAAYTDFYPFISSKYSYILSADMEYNFNMSFAVVFGAGTIYAYELRPALHYIEPGIQQVGITDSDTFTPQIRSDRWFKDSVYQPGDRVQIFYYYTDSSGNLLNRLLSFSDARLIFPMVTVWDPEGVPIANNFGTEDFFKFDFDLPLSAAMGEYRAKVTLDAGIYGKIEGDLRFYVQPASDAEPPQIAFLEIPPQIEAGEDLPVVATVSDNVGIVGNPSLQFSAAGEAWREIPMIPAGGYIYQADISSDLLAIGELKWRITAQDKAGNTVERTGTTIIKDTSPPTIDHKPIAIAELGRDLQIQAKVEDKVAVSEAILFYSVSGEDDRATTMSGSGTTYSASIPGAQITFDGISYYIRATDSYGNVALLPPADGAPEYIHALVKDTIPPAISHIPINIAIADTSLRVEAIIIDNSKIVEAELFYKNGSGQSYRSMNMEKTGDVYSAEIPPEDMAPGIMHYHISASDGLDPDGNTRTSTSPVDGSDYQVEIRSGPQIALTRLEISTSALDIAAGQRMQFTVTGRGGGGEMLPIEPIWTATDGIGYIDQEGLFLATGRITGDGTGRIIATARQIGMNNALLQAEARVRVSPGETHHIILNPTSVTMAAGTTQRSFATVTDSYYNPRRQQTVNWRVDGVIGTIENGIFTASKAGSGNLIAEIDGIQASSRVTVTPGQLSRILIRPSPPYSFSGVGNVEHAASLLKVEGVVAGSTVQFIAEGYDSFGNYTPIAPVWSIQGNIGIIQGDGLFRGGTAGTGQVVATIGDIRAAVEVQVVPGQLYSVSVRPYNAYVPVSTKERPSMQQFAADGRDIAGNHVPLKSVSWTTDKAAGNISSSGLFTATDDPGVRLGEIVTNGTIWASGTSAAGHLVTGTATVVIQKSPAGNLSSVDVFVQGTSGTESVSLATGKSIKLEAAGKDAKGRNLSIDPLWSVEGGIGNIDPGGKFIATNPGSGAILATAGGFTGRMQVEVTPGSVRSITIRPDMLILTPGKQHTLMATGYDSSENIVPLHNVQWSVEGEAVSIEPTDSLCIVRASKSGNSIISARSGELAGFANISVVGCQLSVDDEYQPFPAKVGTTYYLQIDPNPINVIVGSQQKFFPRAFDVFGNELDPGILSWSVAGDIGEIDNSGIFRADSRPGSGRIVVTDGRIFGTAAVSVSEFTRAEKLIIIPSVISLTAGSVQRFSAIAQTEGKLIPISPAWNVTGGIGTIDASGRFVAVTAGEGKVEAIAGSLSTRVSVTVLSGEPAALELLPGSISIKAGEHRKFSFVCKDSMGNQVDSSPTFQVAGDLGTIDGSGIFTARKVGAGYITAAVPSIPLLARATVEVLPGNLTEIRVIPEEQILTGGIARFSATGRDAYGNVIPVDPLWEISKRDTGNISSNGTFTADKAGQGKISAKAGKITDSVSIEVLPGQPAFILVEPALLSVSPQSPDATQFSFTLLDSRGNIAEAGGKIEVSWSATWGIGSIDPQTGLFLSEKNLDQPRSGNVTATAIITSDSGMTRTIRGKAAVILQPIAKPLASIAVTPNPAAVVKGEKLRFTATGKDSSGKDMAVYANWIVISVEHAASLLGDDSKQIQNAISQDGIFSATPEMKVGTTWRVLAYTLDSQNWTIQGEATVSLISGPLQSIDVLCQESVLSGQTVEIQAFGYDQFRNQVEIAPDWKVTGGIGSISPGRSKNEAVLTAGYAGSGEVIALAQGKEGKIRITVEPGQLMSIDISTEPAQEDDKIGKNRSTPLVIKAGTDIRFTALGYDSQVDILGRAKPVYSISISPTWSVVSADEAIDPGFISANGRFDAREAGAGKIEARVGSVVGSFYIQVVPGNLASIRVSPFSVSIADEGMSQQFFASGYDVYGNQIANLEPAWQVTGNIGAIDKNGVLTPAPLPPESPDISGTVVASYGGIQGSSSVTIVSALGELSTLSLTVDPTIIQAGGQAICILTGIDERGNPLADLPGSAEPSLSVPSGLGTLSPSSKASEWIFRAVKNLPYDPVERAGTVSATVRFNDKTLSDSTLITLTPGPLSKINIEPATVNVPAGSTTAIKASGYDLWGNQRELKSLEWSVTPDLGSITRDPGDPQSAAFTAVTAGQGKLTARSQGYEAQVDLTVQPGSLEALAIVPKTLTIAAGSSHDFTSIGRDKHGNEIKDPAKLSWQIIGDAAIGSVTEDGIFSAERAGNGKLRVVYTENAALYDEASITVIPGPIASVNIDIHKDGKKLEPPFTLFSGFQYDLSALGVDALGNPISKIGEVTWSTAEDTGLIVPSLEDLSAAVISALFPGRGRITITFQELSSYIELEIIPHSQTISSQKGGILSGPFEASINFPPGAFRSDEKISIALSPSPGSAEHAQRIGHVLSLKPEGKILETPAELKLSYSAGTTEIHEEKLSLYSWDRFQNKWIKAGGVVDTHQKSVTAIVNYLTLFTIMQENPEIQDTSPSSDLEINDIRLSPNTYFAPETNRLTIHYNIGYTPRQIVYVTTKIYDIRGHLVRELLDKSPKYPGWNTDQWDGTDETGEIVRNGRYFLLLNAEADGSEVSKVKHLAVFR